MAPWVELRCVCKTPGGKHPLLGKARGQVFDVQIKCKCCRRLMNFRLPNPLSASPVTTEIPDPK